MYLIKYIYYILHSNTTYVQLGLPRKSHDLATLPFLQPGPFLSLFDAFQLYQIEPAPSMSMVHIYQHDHSQLDTAHII